MCTHAEGFTVDLITAHSTASPLQKLTIPVMRKKINKNKNLRFN